MAKNPEHLTRKALAAYFPAHDRTIAKWLKVGLASAIEDFGSGSRPMTFDMARVERWLRAYRCQQRGIYCSDCRHVLNDCVAVGEHLIEQRHGYGGCRDCRVTWTLRQPCSWEGDVKERRR